VVDHTVYTFARRGGDEVLSAMEASTGKEAWSTSYAAPYAPSAPTLAHGAGPKSTPVFHDGRLFTLGISGVVAAFDASSGHLLWRTQAPSEHPYFSAASSPVVEAGLVIAHPGNYGPLTAFDAATGAVRWSAGESGFFASPLIATFAGTRQAIAVTLKHVIGVSLTEGRVLWRYPWAGAAGGPMPALYGDTVIVSGLDQGVSAFTPIQRDGVWTAQRAWDTNDVSIYLSHPVVVGGTLFGFSHRARGQYFALDANTGATLWLGPPRQATNAAVVSAGDALLLLEDDAELIVAKRSRTGLEPLRRYGVGDGPTWAQPVLSGNRLFVKHGARLTLWTLR